MQYDRLTSLDESSGDGASSSGSDGRRPCIRRAHGAPLKNVTAEALFKVGDITLLGVRHEIHGDLIQGNRLAHALDLDTTSICKAMSGKTKFRVNDIDNHRSGSTYYLREDTEALMLDLARRREDQRYNGKLRHLFAVLEFLDKTKKPEEVEKLPEEPPDPFSAFEDPLAGVGVFEEPDMSDEGVKLEEPLVRPWEAPPASKPAAPTLYVPPSRGIDDAFNAIGHRIQELMDQLNDLKSKFKAQGANIEQVQDTLGVISRKINFKLPPREPDGRMEEIEERIVRSETELSNVIERIMKLEAPAVKATRRGKKSDEPKDESVAAMRERLNELARGIVIARYGETPEDKDVWNEPWKGANQQFEMHTKIKARKLADAHGVKSVLEGLARSNLLRTYYDIVLPWFEAELKEAKEGK